MGGVWLLCEVSLCRQRGNCKGRALCRQQACTVVLTKHSGSVLARGHDAERRCNTDIRDKGLAGFVWTITCSKGRLWRQSLKINNYLDCIQIVLIAIFSDLFTWIFTYER